MADKVTVSQLPEEILEAICSCNCLCVADILRLGETCQRFRSVVHSNELWRKKLIQRWQNIPITKTAQSYRYIYKSYYQLEQALLRTLQHIAKDTYTLDGIPKYVFEKVHTLFNDTSLMDVVLYLLKKYSQERLVGGDLNIKYYAEKVYKYAYHHYLKRRWHDVLQPMNPSKENLEKGAILISQWCSSYKVKEEAVYKQLDDIAGLVKEQLPPTNCKTYSEVMNIIHVINKVLYKELLFKGNTSFYYNIHNSYIDQVLSTKKGIPISLSVLYMAVARRVGLDIHGVNFPGHFLMQVPVLKSGNLTKIYIDAFDKGTVMDEEACIQWLMPNAHTHEVPRDILFQIAEERKIFIRMVANIVNILRQHASMDSRNLDTLQSALELMLLLAPNDEENKLLLSRIYLHYGINLEEVITNLEGMFSSNRGLRVRVLDSLLQHAEERKNDRKQMDIKYRTDVENVSVKYRIGMVMKHKRYHYYCVIFGWDPYCKMDESWQLQMGVQNLANKEKQPFYNVLVHDGTTRYASQENLGAVMVGRPIQHLSVGKHFKVFDGYHYIATSMLQECYPEDQPIPGVELPAEPFTEDIEPI